MFHQVWLQSGDSPKELIALGLKLKRKHKGQLILQPCPAYQGDRCGIYHQRPERCRLFECRQLKRVSSGEISESMALDKIQEVVSRVAQVNGLFCEAGKTDPKKPLTKRYEKLTAEPLDGSADERTVALRGQLTLAMRELEELLEKDFRL